MNNEIKDNIPARTSPGLTRSSFATTRNRVANDIYFPYVRLFGVRSFCYYPYFLYNDQQIIAGHFSFGHCIVCPSFFTASASDKVYQLLSHGRWFSPASSTTKTGRHDIAEILLKVALNTTIQNSNSIFTASEYQYIFGTKLFSAY